MWEKTALIIAMTNMAAGYDHVTPLRAGRAHPADGLAGVDIGKVDGSANTWTIRRASRPCFVISPYSRGRLMVP